eukprot:74323_1
MAYHPVTIECESDFSYKEWFVGSQGKHLSIEMLHCKIRLKRNVKTDKESRKKLCVDALIGWNLKARRLHSATFLNLLSSTQTENTNNDAKTEAIKILLMEKHKGRRVNNNGFRDDMDDYQTEDVFDNAELLSELIFSEKAIEKVNNN